MSKKHVRGKKRNWGGGEMGGYLFLIGRSGGKKGGGVIAKNNTKKKGREKTIIQNMKEGERKVELTLNPAK